MKIYIGADHGGYQLKEELKAFLAQKGYEVEDLGAKTLDPQDDYPDFVIPTAREVAQNLGSFGIVLGRSGNGEAIAANKVEGIRAALCLSEEMAKKAREHNDANVLSLGGDFVDSDTAKKIVETFLNTPFSNEERHVRRIKKITEYESAHSG
ncbi:MAG: ribose-5-phosphate isomerase [bacterium]|nr:ribose-5-phosphate isomerase [bacterium]